MTGNCILSGEVENDLSLELRKVKTEAMSHLDGVVGVGDDGDEKAEHHVDEE